MLTHFERTALAGMCALFLAVVVWLYILLDGVMLVLQHRGYGVPLVVMGLFLIGAAVHAFIACERISRDERS